MEHELNPKSCFENSNKARRNQNEIHVSFILRLMPTWENYCKIGGAESDFFHLLKIKLIYK